ncbi:SPFH domain-containing protein [Streptomyces alkaliphilus]|uniref:SPFH domain-containing protein n=1 Tax=Streptomyces alkaliphilus TaxID=1472722 RepID=UPI00117CAC46|nr:SPFH domain-containing protein [Streptomyces alkaliphilus]MQS06287.1 SPFH domain-containing protein [Streptomyces alkaliphilus]
MSLSQNVRQAARSVARGGDPRQAAAGLVNERVQNAFGGAGDRRGGGDPGEEPDANTPGVADPEDFLAARDHGASIGTRIEQKTTSLNGAGEAVNRSETERTRSGTVHVICPMVLPRGRTLITMLPAVVLIAIGLVAVLVLSAMNAAVATNPLFGVHYWVLTLLAAGFMWWRQGMVMVPEGCQALITRFGKLEQVVGPGRVILFNPWKRVSYIVNTTREYPFNAPIREAPTRSGVQASIDLFVQFRINDPVEFIYTLGAVRGFQEKLNNAISETTRSMIYEQEASAIYDMVGENTNRLLEQLNQQFSPAVELTNANITHAEPSSQEYRMDLAAPEMVRVAKEAYTHEYELQLRKEHNEGDLNKELASLNETLSAIQADIAQYQAQMDTALERETNRARSVARQRFVEAESEARANAALLEAQALDIRAVSAAKAPEILNHRYRQQVLDTLEGVADRLPQVVKIGSGEDASVNFLSVARGIIGETGEELFTESDMQAIRARMEEISARIAEREEEIRPLRQTGPTTVQAPVLSEEAAAAEASAEAGLPEGIDVPTGSTSPPGDVVPPGDTGPAAPGAAPQDTPQEGEL